MRSRTPSLDRIALLAAGLLLPILQGCVTTQPGEAGGHARIPMPPVMPPIDVAQATQSQGNQSIEPPLADIFIPPRPFNEASVRDILPVRPESPGITIEGMRSANFDEPATDSAAPWAITESQPTESPLVVALRSLLNKSPEQAAQALENLDPADRDLLTALLPLVIRLGDGALKSGSPQDIETLMADVQAMVAPLRERAALVVPKLCFCRPVAAPPRFGKYDPLEENHLFRAGEVVGLYFEVRNFTSAPTGSDYRTQVQTAIEVQNDRGETIWRSDTPAGSDRSLSPRQDYCHVGWFALLPNMPAGAYTLWLKVTDVPTGRTARRSLDFRVTTVKEVKSGGVGE